MSENLTSDNNPHDDFNLKTKEKDYKILITKLKEINSSIALLEKTLLR